MGQRKKKAKQHMCHQLETQVSLSPRRMSDICQSITGQRISVSHVLLIGKPPNLREEKRKRKKRKRLHQREKRKRLHQREKRKRLQQWRKRRRKPRRRKPRERLHQ